MYKILSLALNTFVPNKWDYAVTPSLYEPEIYFPMKERFDDEKDLKAALEYCRTFVDKICSNTNLKLLHYLSYNEFVVFLSNPSDAYDAESVAKNVTPYQKVLDAYFMGKDRETYACDIPINDYILSTMDQKLVQGRKTAVVKPRELEAKTIEGKIVDSISSRPFVEVVAMMKMIDSYFIIEQEKLGLILDMAPLNWDAIDSLKDSLRKAACLIDDNSSVICKAILGIIAKKGVTTFADSLVTLIKTISCRRDVLGLKSLILLAHGFVKPENVRVFANLSLELAEAVKASEFPKDLMYCLRCLPSIETQNTCKNSRPKSRTQRSRSIPTIPRSFMRRKRSSISRTLV